MQKFHPALWLWGITNTDDGYLLWSWADKWPFCEVTLPSSKKGRDCFGAQNYFLFSIDPPYYDHPNKIYSYCQIKKVLEHLKGRVLRAGLRVFFLHFWCLNCSSCWGPSIACFFFLLMFLEQKILRPPHWTTILGEKSNTTCHQIQTMFTNKEMWFLFFSWEIFPRHLLCRFALQA